MSETVEVEVNEQDVERKRWTTESRTPSFGGEGKNRGNGVHDWNFQDVRVWFVAKGSDKRRKQSDHDEVGGPREEELKKVMSSCGAEWVLETSSLCMRSL